MLDGDKEGELDRLLLCSLCFALLALGPFFVGEANLFLNVVLVALLESPSGKCLEQILI